MVVVTLGVGSATLKSQDNDEAGLNAVGCHAKTWGQTELGTPGGGGYGSG